MIKACAFCGKSFEPRHARIKYCSAECHRTVVFQQKRDSYYRNIDMRRPVVPKPQPARKKKCPACGNIFTTAFPTERFCSDTCRINFFFSSQDFYARATDFSGVIEMEACK